MEIYFGDYRCAVFLSLLCLYFWCPSYGVAFEIPGVNFIKCKLYECCKELAVNIKGKMLEF